MSDKTVYYICVTFLFCFYFLCNTVQYTVEKIYTLPPKQEKTLEQVPLNLEDLLVPKSIFPDTKKLEMPNSKNSTYAG